MIISTANSVKIRNNANIDKITIAKIPYGVFKNANNSSFVAFAYPPKVQQLIENNTEKWDKHNRCQINKQVGMLTHSKRQI